MPGRCRRTSPPTGCPLPFAYESTGEVTQFTNLLEPDARSREVFTFHRPEELIRLVKLDDQVRAKLQDTAAAGRREALVGADGEHREPGAVARRRTSPGR